MKFVVASVLAAIAAANWSLGNSRNPIYGRKAVAPPAPVAPVAAPIASASYSHRPPSSYPHKPPSSYPHMPSHHKPMNYGHSHSYSHHVHKPPTQYGGYTNYGNHHVHGGYKSKFMTPNEKLAYRLEHLEKKYYALEAKSTFLVWDFFFVNDSEIAINGDNTFTFLPPEGFCVEGGQTVDIIATVTSNSRGNGRGVIEITKNGVQVARSVQFDGN